MQQEKLYAILADSEGIVAIENRTGGAMPCVFLNHDMAKHIFDRMKSAPSAPATLMRLVEFNNPVVLDSSIVGTATAQ